MKNAARCMTITTWVVHMGNLTSLPSVSEIYNEIGQVNYL